MDPPSRSTAAPTTRSGASLSGEIDRETLRLDAGLYEERHELDGRLLLEVGDEDAAPAAPSPAANYRPSPLRLRPGHQDLAVERVKQGERAHRRRVKTGRLAYPEAGTTPAAEPSVMRGAWCPRC